MLNQIVYEALSVLTATPFQPILAPLSALSGSNGIQTPFATYQGCTKPLFTVVFFRLKSICRIDLHPIMVDCYGRMLLLLGVIISGLKPLQSATQRFRPLLGGLPLNQGHAAMNILHSGETAPKIQKLIFELESIETLSLQSNNLTCSNPRKVLSDIFRHSQNALNLLHDLKNLQA